MAYTSKEIQFLKALKDKGVSQEEAFGRLKKVKLKSNLNNASTPTSGITKYVGNKILGHGKRLLQDFGQTVSSGVDTVGNVLEYGDRAISKLTGQPSSFDKPLAYKPAQEALDRGLKTNVLQGVASGGNTILDVVPATAAAKVGFDVMEDIPGLNLIPKALGGLMNKGSEGLQAVGLKEQDANNIVNILGNVLFAKGSKKGTARIKRAYQEGGLPNAIYMTGLQVPQTVIDTALMPLNLGLQAKNAIQGWMKKGTNQPTPLVPLQIAPPKGFTQGPTTPPQGPPTKSGVSFDKTILENKYKKQNTADWGSVLAANQRGNKTLQKISDRQAKVDIVSPQILTNLGVQHNKHIVDGKYETLETAQNLRDDAGGLSTKLLRPVLVDLDTQIPRNTPLGVVMNNAITRAEKRGGKDLADIIAEIQKTLTDTRQGSLAQTNPNGLTRVGLHDNKIEYAKGVYNPTAPAKNIADKYISDAMRQILEDISPGAPVKAFNGELQKIYAAATYLAELNAKPMPKSWQRKATQLGAKFLGATLGHSLGGGFASGFVGYQAGAYLEGMMAGLSNPVKNYFLDRASINTPQPVADMGNFTKGVDIYGQPKNPLLSSPQYNSRSAQNVPTDTTLPGGEQGYFGGNIFSNPRQQKNMSNTSTIGEQYTKNDPIVKGIANQGLTRGTGEVQESVSPMRKAYDNSGLKRQSTPAETIAESMSAMTKGDMVFNPQEVIQYAKEIVHGKYAEADKIWLYNKAPKEIKKAIENEKRAIEKAQQATIKAQENKQRSEKEVTAVVTSFRAAYGDNGDPLYKLAKKIVDNGIEDFVDLGGKKRITTSKSVSGIANSLRAEMKRNLPGKQKFNPDQTLLNDSTPSGMSTDDFFTEIKERYEGSLKNETEDDFIAQQEKAWEESQNAMQQNRASFENTPSKTLHTEDTPPDTPPEAYTPTPEKSVEVVSTPKPVEKTPQVEGKTRTDEVKNYKNAEDFATSLGLKIEKVKMKKGDVKFELSGDNTTIRIPDTHNLSPERVEKAIMHEIGHYFDEPKFEGGRMNTNVDAKYFTSKLSQPNRDILSKNKDWILKQKEEVIQNLDFKVDTKDHGVLKFDNIDEIKKSDKISKNSKFQMLEAYNKAVNKYRDYRAQPPELFADGFSLYAIDRGVMKKEAPELYSLYEKVFTDDSRLANMYSTPQSPLAQEAKKSSLPMGEKKGTYDEVLKLSKDNIKITNDFEYFQSLPKEPRGTRKTVKIIGANPGPTDMILKTREGAFQRNSQTMYKKVPIKVLTENIAGGKRYKVVDKTGDILDTYDGNITKEEVIELLRKKGAEFIK